MFYKDTFIQRKYSKNNYSGFLKQEKKKMENGSAGWRIREIKISQLKGLIENKFSAWTESMINSNFWINKE